MDDKNEPKEDLEHKTVRDDAHSIYDRINGKQAINLITKLLRRRLKRTEIQH
jgi:hypothetical protein